MDSENVKKKKINEKDKGRRVDKDKPARKI